MAENNQQKTQGTETKKKSIDVEHLQTIELVSKLSKKASLIANADEAELNRGI